MTNEIARPPIEDRASKIVAYALREATSQALTPQVLVPAVMNAFRKVRGLSDCTNLSIIGALSSCASLGLAPCTPRGHAYLIPFKGEATVIIGYKGYLELARRTGAIRTVHADVVLVGEDFDLVGGTGGLRVTHRPDPRRALCGITRETAAERLLGAYCVVETTDGAHYAQWVSAADVDAARKRGASGKGKSTPWDTDYAAMARKTAVRAMFASGEAPMSEELARAIEIDDPAVEEVAAQVAVTGRPVLPGGDAVAPKPPDVLDSEEIEPDAHAAAVERAVAHLDGKGLLADAEAHVQRSAADWTPEDLDAIRAWIREHAPSAR